MITDLPSEVLTEILKQVPGKDSGQVARVCKRFHTFYSEDWVWRDLCRNELGLEVGELENPRLIYQHIHFHYGALQGLFRRCGVPGGGLIQVSYRNKCLIGVDIQVDRYGDLYKRCTKTPLFAIKLGKIKYLSALSRKKELIGECIFGKSKHECQIQVKRLNKRACGQDMPRPVYPGFSICCHSKKYHEHTENLVGRWVSKCGIDRYDYDADDYKNTLINKLQTCFRFSFSYDTVTLQKDIPPVPGVDLRDVLIKPGLFVGDFYRQNNGLQIVCLTYELWERLPYMVMRKITNGFKDEGGSTVTLRSKMENIKVIDWDFEEPYPTMQEVEDKNHVTYIELEDLKNRPQQDFSLPMDCDCIDPNIPDNCVSVFRGEMFVDDGTQHWKSEWAEGYIVVFSEEKFGFLNFRKKYFHMFRQLKLD